MNNVDWIVIVEIVTSYNFTTVFRKLIRFRNEHKENPKLFKALGRSTKSAFSRLIIISRNYFSYSSEYFALSVTKCPDLPVTLSSYVLYGPSLCIL